MCPIHKKKWSIRRFFFYNMQNLWKDLETSPSPFLVKRDQSHLISMASYPGGPSLQSAGLRGSGEAHKASVTSPAKRDCSGWAFPLCSRLENIHGHFGYWSELVFPPPAQRSLRRHPYKVLQGASHRKYWNKLPASVVWAPSVNVFKNRLDEVWTEHLPKLFSNPPPPIISQFHLRTAHKQLSPNNSYHNPTPGSKYVA